MNKKWLFWIVAILMLFITIHSASAASPFLSNMVHYYTFDNVNSSNPGGNPTMIDAFRTANITSSVNTPTWNLTGQNLEAWDYESTSSEYSIIDSDNAFSTQINTHCIWVKPDTLGLTANRLWSGDDSRTRWSTYLNSNNRANLVYFSSGVNGACTGATALKNTKYYFLCFVYDVSKANEMFVYVNGTQDANCNNAGVLDQPGGTNRLSNLVTAYGDGLFDEVMFWSDAKSSTFIQALYNTTLAGNYTWIKGGAPPPPVDDLNLSEITPAPPKSQFNSNPVSVWALGNASANWTCRLYINGVVNQTRQLGTGINVNCSFNVTFPNGEWNTSIRGNTTLIDENTSTVTIYFDNVNPIINIINWSNNTIRYNTNITGSWNITDNFYLHRLNASIDGVQVFGIIDINATQYLFNLSSSVTGLSPGNHVLSIQVADGHTANSIVTDSIDWSNGLFNDYLKYEFRPPYDETYINIVNKDASIWDSWKTTPLKDRYTFSFEPSIVTKTITLDITSNSKIHIAKNKELTWLIFNDHWLDFAPYEVNFNIINDYYIQAIIQNPGMDEKLEFNSIGDLNIVTRNFTFATTNMTVVYSTLVNELSYTTSTLTILKNAAIINTSATFSWNGTLFNVTADRSNASFDYYNITYFINAISTATTTVPIVWFYNVTGIVNNLTGNLTFNQTILQIGIDNCSVYTVRAINITLLDEGNNSPIIGSIDGYFNVWIGSLSAFREFNLTWRGNSSYGLCINNPNVTYLTNGQMEYYNPSHTPKTYYLVNETLDNSTEILNLYLTLNTTQIILAVFDENGDPIKDVYIHVQSYDLGTNSYHTTEITRTDYKGESFAQMILNTQWYQFMLVYNGATVLQTDPTKIIDTYLAFQINLGSISLQDWIESKDVLCTISFNNATNNFRMTFSNPTGNAVTATLNVYNSSTFSKQLIGSNTLNAASGTLLVNIGAPGNFTYVGNGVLTINGYQYPCGSSVTVNYGGDYHTWGLQGIFYLMLLIIAAATTFIFGPEISIIAVLAVLGIGWFAGLIGLGGGSIATIIIIGGIIVYRLTRK